MKKLSLATAEIARDADEKYFAVIELQLHPITHIDVYFLKLSLRVVSCME